ncbi:MAG: Maf family protein [Oscillospiraceae bacterium]
MILASQSPRRRELLGIIAGQFDVIPAQGEELLPEGISPRDAVILLSQQKAEEIRRRKFPGEVTNTIIAADTVVAIDGVILGKPSDRENAAAMLRQLSGRKHSVFTGVTLITPQKTVSFAEETLVEFYPLTEQEISDYVATGEPMDKAGAYGIQGRGALLVKRIEGDYYNVMGLPVGRLYREL